MSWRSNEVREPVPSQQVFGEHLIAPLPDGSQMEAAFVLVKLDDGDWCARQVGPDYNRVEFFGQLSAYTRSLLQSEAEGRFEDDNDAHAARAKPRVRVPGALLIEHWWIATL